MIQLSSKDIKQLYDFNQVVKNNFTHYYLRYNGEAAAPLLYHKTENVLSYSTTQLPIYEFFNLLNLSPNEVLFIDSNALYKALNKKNSIKECYISDGQLIISTSNKDIVKNTPWEIINNTVYVPVAKIVPADECNKSFDLNKENVLSHEKFVDISEEIDKIMSKKIVKIENNGFVITMAKPLLPAINNKCKLKVFFQPYKDELFKAHFLLEKEQVCNYHTYIAYTIF